MTNSWSGRKVQEARAIVATWLPMQCGRCPRTVDGTTPWVVGHIISRALRPDLMWDPTNWQPEHRACSDRTGQAAVIEKARAEGAAAERTGGFSSGGEARKPPPLPVSLSSSSRGVEWEVPARLRWSHHVASAPEWLAPFLVVPEDAAPPLAMTEVHPLAVCSYAAESCDHAWRGVPFVVPPNAVEWVQRSRGIRLRWWQRLAFVRQLEHDVDGRLVWRGVVESGPRRIGKSERLRSMALWRMEFGPRLFEPGQLVMHFGRTLDVVREVQERAWPWCEAQGWEVSRNNNNRAVTHPNGARWLAKNSAYTFDVHLGLADECWDVEPGRISEDLEPAALERESAQVVLTSTSHRKATSLMKRRISAALDADDGRTLLLLWGIEPGADIFDEATWKAASAHWTQDRRDQIAAKLVEAREAPVTLDDPDPVGSWAHQYLNRWDLIARPKTKGELLVDEDTWGRLEVEVPFEVPAAAAIESWFDEGVTLALGWRDGTRVRVSATGHETLAEAVAALRGTEFRGVVTVGSSMMADPALVKVRKKPGEGRPSAAAAELLRLLGEDVVRHDGQEHLSGQVLALRTSPGVGGPRMTSTERADAVKAMVWVVAAARATRGKPRLLLPSSGN